MQKVLWNTSFSFKYLPSYTLESWYHKEITIILTISSSRFPSFRLFALRGRTKKFNLKSNSLKVPSPFFISFFFYSFIFSLSFFTFLEKYGRDKRETRAAKETNFGVSSSGGGFKEIRDYGLPSTLDLVHSDRHCESQTSKVRKIHSRKYRQLQAHMRAHTQTHRHIDTQVLSGKWLWNHFLL